MLAPHFREVLAFEPNKELFQKWKETPQNVTRYAYALSNRNGTASLYLGSGEGSLDSLLKEFNYNPGLYHDTAPRRLYVGERAITVETRTYDSFHFDQTQLVKIDVEGFEREVLEGMENSLASKMVDNIMIEVHNRDWEESLTEHLRSYGFRVKRVDDHPHLFGSLRD